MKLKSCISYTSITTKITKDKVYDCLLEYKDWYVIIDDNDTPEVCLKSYFTLIEVL